MGQCYYITLKAKLRDERGAVAALNKKIARAEEERTIYSLDGYDRDSFDDLMKIFLADSNEPLELSTEEGMRAYKNSFSCSYGWESVMIEMFETIAPYLEDGSNFSIFPDNGEDYMEVHNGKVEYTEYEDEDFEEY